MEATEQGGSGLDHTLTGPPGDDTTAAWLLQVERECDAARAELAVLRTALAGGTLRSDNPSASWIVQCTLWRMIRTVLVLSAGNKGP